MRTHYILLALLVSICTPVFAQKPTRNNLPPPPPPIEDNSWKGNRDKYNYGNGDEAPAKTNKIDQLAGFIEDGTPLIAKYNNLDSLLIELDKASILVSPFCQDLPGENSIKVCVTYDPPAIMFNEAAFKNTALLTSLITMPGNNNHVYAISFVKITRKGKKPEPEFEDNFRKKVTDLISLLGIYFPSADIDDLFSKKGTALIDNYQCEVISSDASGNASIRKMGDDIEAFSVVIKTKTTVKPNINVALDSTQNALLQADLVNYQKHVKYIDSLQYACDYYDLEENLSDSLYTNFSTALYPACKSTDVFIDDFRKNFNLEKTMRWKDYGDDVIGLTGTTKGKQKIYVHASNYYSNPSVSSIYIYTPIPKGNPKKVKKQLVNFTKEVLKNYNFAYNDSMAYYMDQERYNSWSNDFFTVNVKCVNNPQEYWGTEYLSLDTMEAGSTANPYYYINLYAITELKDSAAYRIASDSIFNYYDTKSQKCDSAFKQYTKANKFVWKTLPPMVVKEDYQTTVLVPAFLQPDTLVKTLKKIVNDTSKFYGLYSYKYNWQLYGAETYSNSLTAPTCNIALSSVLKENTDDARYISLTLETNTGTTTPDSLQQKYNTIKADIFKHLNITLPKDVEESAATKKWAYYNTSAYTVFLKQGVENDGIVYSAIRIYPLTTVSVGYTPFASDINLTDTLYHIIPADVMNKALATADTLWVEELPENFQNAAKLVANLKKHGFNKFWVEDEQSYTHFEDNIMAENYLINNDFSGKEVLMIPKKGDAATAAILYYFGPSPPNYSTAFSHFTHTGINLADALDDRIPLSVSMAINSNTTTQSLTNTGLMCNYFYNLNYNNSETKMGMALMFATKYYLTSTDE